MVKLIEPKLIKQKDLNNNIRLLDALNELEVTEEENRNYLSAKYQDLLTNEKEIRKEFQAQPDYLDRLYGIFVPRGKNARFTASLSVKIRFFSPQNLN